MKVLFSNLFKVRLSKIVSLLLCLAVLTCLLPQATLSGADEISRGNTNDETVTATAVIEQELADVMKSSSETELIPVSVWVDEIDTQAVEAQVLKDIGVNKERIDYLDSVEDRSAETLADEYIAAERRIYSDLQGKVNRDFWSSVTAKKSVEPTRERRLYICSYSPTIITELTKQEIADVADDPATEAILYYKDAFELPVVDDFAAEDETVEDLRAVTSNSTEQALASIRVPEVHAMGYTGSGIKIGQLEIHVPDTSWFSSASITIRPGSASNSNLHATRVMEMMLNVAPDAQYYCTNYPNSFEDSVEWLLLQGVNVINNSSIGTATGTYSAQDKWVDHLAINHSVHFVQAAGNNNGYVGRPGMAYNVVTVGAANAALNARRSTSSYLEDGSLDSTKSADKPDIIAPGSDLYFTALDEDSGHYSSGTSFAAPIVTGIAALMMQSRTALKTRQASLKACMLASIRNSTLRYVPSSSMYGQCGAGLIDANSSVVTAKYAHFTTGQYFSAGAAVGTTKTYTFTASSSDTIKRVALNWLQYNTVTGTHSTATPTVGSYVDLDLSVLDSYGDYAALSYVSYGNVEIVQFTPTPGETYTIKVRTCTSPQQTVHFSVAWW